MESHYAGSLLEVRPIVRKPSFAEQATLRLVLSNVIGFVYIHLQGALADGETLLTQPALAPLLRTLLYQRRIQKSMHEDAGRRERPFPRDLVLRASNC